MARESNPPADPINLGKPREQTSRPVPHQPEFGVPSPLGRPSYPQHHGISNPFNIPKQNRPRPEHHRPQQQRPRPHNPLQQNATRPNIPPLVASTPKRSEPFDPFKPVRPSAYNNNRISRPADNDVVEIRRPENITFGTPRAPKTFYASKPSPIKQTNAAKNLQKFVDLTSPGPTGGGFSTSRTPGNTGFGSVGANDWVDTAKANENIKALLEGAFEDEDEKQPKPKSKKKNKKNKAKKNNQSQEKVAEKSLGMDDLAAQLQGVTVNETQRANDDFDDVQGNDSTQEKNIEKGEDKDTKDENDISDAGSETEEDEEDEDDDGTVEGLNVKLLPHQRQGLNWMCEKEIGSRKTKKEGKGVLPKGGILADDMGLGKTVQAIALLLTNQKPKDGTRRRPALFDYDQESDDSDDDGTESRNLPEGLSKSTLVVAPLALIKQWESEIKSKVEAPRSFRVLVYHGNTRAKSTDRLDDYDVVITTYGTLTSEHNAVSKNDKKAGVFSVHWYRIILDEAHTIKNRNAKATQAAYSLDAEYRWCLSGTPMQNNLDELQSLIRFLQIKPYNDLAHWKDQITRPLANGRGGLAIERLQVVLKAFMKRRTKDVLKLNANLKPGEGDADGGKKNPGFQITKREVIKVAVEFMPGETNFYQRLEQRTENSLEKMMGDSKLDYAGALVLLLRLRQCCNHPDLVKSDLAKDKDILLQTGASNSQSSGKSNDLDDVADLFGALSVVTKKCDICQMEMSQAESADGGSRCNGCEKDFNTPFAADGAKKTSKNSVDLTASPLERHSEDRVARVRRNRKIVMDSDDEEDEDGEWLVPEGQRAQLSLGKAGGSDDEDAEGGGEWIGTGDSETDDEPESPTQRKRSQKFPVDEDSEDDIYLNPGDDENQVLPSTKVRELMKILRREAPEFKFIVFSVFTSMLDRVEPFLKRAGIGYARYDGSMRNDLREASLDKLRNHQATRVLLCSLRAGALGLNLTAASRVVILEPFWNPFVEEQAIDRVHRLNQTLDVKIYKMIIKDTVEERILDLQDRKRELANVTIEGKKAAAKLTMNDMMALFGKDAETRYTGGQSHLEFSPQKKSLLSSNYESTSQGRSDSGLDGSRDRKSKQERRVPSTEHSVYGRRW